MTLEDVGAVKAFLRCTATSWTESTDHRTLVVCKGVSVLVVLSRKPLGVVFAGGDWALLGTFVLVCEQMCLEILDVSTARGDWTDTLVLFRVERRVAVARLVGLCG